MAPVVGVVQVPGVTVTVPALVVPSPQSIVAATELVAPRSKPGSEKVADRSTGLPSLPDRPEPLTTEVCVTVICWPRTVMWAVRAAPVLAEKEKWTTPLATLVMLSQLWSLWGAKGPVSGWLAGSTGSSWSEPAAAVSPSGPPGTNARGSSLMALLRESEKKTLPAPSTATPKGPPSPETRVLTCFVLALYSLMALLPVSAMKTLPAPSTATPIGRLSPE